MKKMFLAVIVMCFVSAVVFSAAGVTKQAVDAGPGPLVIKQG